MSEDWLIRASDMTVSERNTIYEAIMKVETEREGLQVRTKFNIKKCARCKYHGTILSRTLGNVKNISCDYAALANAGTCITRNGEDKRGNDPDNCRLFEAGKSLARSKKNMTL